MPIDAGHRVHVDRSGVVEMALPYAEAFPLFNGEGRSRAVVRYRMTSLSPDADDFVRAFADGFDDMMAHWAEAIQRHIVEGVPS